MSFKTTFREKTNYMSNFQGARECTLFPDYASDLVPFRLKVAFSSLHGVFAYKIEFRDFRFASMGEMPKNMSRPSGACPTSR
jgi:hypothetical protein